MNILPNEDKSILGGDIMKRLIHNNTNKFASVLKFISFLNKRNLDMIKFRIFKNK